MIDLLKINNYSTIIYRLYGETIIVIKSRDLLHYFQNALNV